MQTLLQPLIISSTEIRDRIIENLIKSKKELPEQEKESNEQQKTSLADKKAILKYILSQGSEPFLKILYLKIMDKLDFKYVKNNFHYFSNDEAIGSMQFEFLLSSLLKLDSNKIIKFHSITPVYFTVNENFIDAIISLYEETYNLVD